ncbi:unnamed protein product [Heterobilharzia americana]|nr:unnamed protein product [Heterobilharzia americana]CAH8625257.1 unnamed protein product [Heterobilharzia americana]
MNIPLITIVLLTMVSSKYHPSVAILLDLQSKKAQLDKMLASVNCSWMKPSVVCRGHLLNRSCFKYGCTNCRCIQLEGNKTLTLQCYQPLEIKVCTRHPYLACTMNSIALQWSEFTKYQCEW